MPENWEIFEDNACEFLNKNVKISNITFKQGGKRNAWESDVHVQYKGNELFLIESKLSPSQCGQFVVLLVKGRYVYSEQNHSPQDEISSSIIDYINNNIGKFEKCGTAGVEIDMPKEVLSNWVRKHYSTKNVKFFITSDSPSGFPRNFIRIIPIENVEDNFKISATLRCKKSGTQPIPLKDFVIVRGELRKRFVSDFSLSVNGIVKLKREPRNLYLGKDYYLSKVDGGYQVRKLSKTNNPSVIFSIRYIREKRTGGFDLLSNKIEESIE